MTKFEIEAARDIDMIRILNAIAVSQGVSPKHVYNTTLDTLAVQWAARLEAEEALALSRRTNARLRAAITAYQETPESVDLSHEYG